MATVGSPDGLEPVRPSKRVKLSPVASSSTSHQQLLPHDIAIMEEAKDSSKGCLPMNQKQKDAVIGIMCYSTSSSNRGWSGILKQRYTDFVVNEITPNGAVVHLTDDQAPNLKNSGKKAPPIDSEPLDTGRGIANVSLGDTVPSVAFKSDAGMISNAAGEENHEPSRTSALETGSTSAQAFQLRSDGEAIQNEKRLDDNNAAFPDTSSVDGEKDPKPSFTIKSEDLDLLAMWFGPLLKDQILVLHEKILSKPNAKPPSFGSLLSEPITDRALRGKIHMGIRRIFEQRLDTQSVTDSKIMITAASKALVASYNNQGGNAKSRSKNPRQGLRGQPKGKLGWDELGGQYLHFSLYKENKDTMEVLSYLCRVLKVKPRDFAFAGTKDRRAATVQRVSVYRQNAPTMARLNNTLRSNVRIGDFKHEKFSLELGELYGNQFTITLRDCHFREEQGWDTAKKLSVANEIVNESVKNIQRDGFINYFGQQRFGTFSIGTHEVGTRILQGDFEGAVNAILSYTKDALGTSAESNNNISQDDIARAKAIYHFSETGDGKEALNKLPRKFSAESSIIRTLMEQKAPKNDWLGALLSIPRGLRTMYVHAYQSLVWNAAASERLMRGQQVMKGDLVLIEKPIVAASRDQDDIDENGEVIVRPAADDTALKHDDIFQRARPLTAEEATSGKFSIFDIVLPTPGFDINYPDNDIGDFYKEFMGSQRGGGLDPAKMRRPQKDFSLSGSYRQLLAVPKDVSFQIKAYSDDIEQLVETDLEKLVKLKSLSMKQQPLGVVKLSDEQHGLDQAGQSSRGHGANSNGTRGQYDDISNSAANQATEQAARDKAHYADTPQMQAWNALPAKLARNEKSDIETAAPKMASESAVHLAEIQQPEYRETFIETKADENGRRITGRSTKIVNADGSLRDLPNEEALITASAVGKSSSNRGASNTGDARLEPMKRSADEISSNPAHENDIIPVNKVAKLDDAFDEASLAVETLPVEKLAVILKFTLGSSQYATMALREMMLTTNVITYKPDFSGGRDNA